MLNTVIINGELGNLFYYSDFKIDNIADIIPIAIKQAMIISKHGTTISDRISSRTDTIIILIIIEVKITIIPCDNALISHSPSAELILFQS